MEEMAIGEVARRAGVRASALRYYESIGILPAPRRVNGRRRYDGEVLELLTVVRVAQQAGFTAAEIRRPCCTGFRQTHLPPHAGGRSPARSSPKSRR